jgi:hypothetical protein
VVVLVSCAEQAYLLDTLRACAAAAARLSAAPAEEAAHWPG